MTGLLAGAGVAEIAIPRSSFPLDGFTAQRDPLNARVLLLDDGSQRIALAVVDLTSLPAGSVAALKEVIASAGGVQPADILLCASHTFSAPHIGPLPEEVVGEAVARATEAARRAVRPSRVGFGTGACRVSVNRAVSTRDGWWHGSDDGGVSDPSLAAIRIDGLDGKPVALVLNYAVQSSVMHESATGDRGKLVTGDLAGAACRHVEGQYGGAVALFLIGAAGDQAPYLTANRYTLDRQGAYSRTDVGEAGYLLVELLGERLGTEAVRVSERIKVWDSGARLAIASTAVTVPAQHIPPRVSDIRPARSYDFRPAGTAEVPVWITRIGDIVLVGLQAELSAATGIAVKNQSPFAKTLVQTMVNGGAKYLPDEASYDRITYPAMNSRYGRGAAEIVAEKLGEILHNLQKEG
jgi:neutral ceramidase